MKNLKIIFGALIIGISAVFVSCIMFPIVGNGNLISSERIVSPFDRISSGGSAEVRFHFSQEYKVVVTTDSNLIEYVEIKTKSNELSIGTKNGHSYSFTKWIVDVYGPNLTGITISGSGTFDSAHKIMASSFVSIVSGSGRINGTIECETLSATISGSGKMNFAGNGKNSNINISGSGDFNGYGFSINNANVRVSGSGKASISVSDNLDANISGSGHINYRGDPKITSSVSGSGRINRM
jgi:hypothetical protein